MENKLRTSLLAGMIKSKRGDMGLRKAAKEIQISSATLSRIEQEKLPDVETFIKICNWLEVPTDTFIETSEENFKASSNKEKIIAHLRADRALPQETMIALTKLIELAYEKT
jgi:transcriptional regulator with XRE-family HTH domain